MIMVPFHPMINVSQTLIIRVRLLGHLVFESCLKADCAKPPQGQVAGMRWQSAPRWKLTVESLARSKKALSLL